MNARSWFEVDRAGLAKVAGRRGKLFILRELIQNAWDEDTTAVNVEVHAGENGGLSTIRVTDDSPEGFADLSHAYTLFAPSKKVTDATKRGRFNFGEKLVLALCSEARVETTKGTVLFDRGEQRRRSPKKREAGSMFEGKLRLNQAERDALVQSCRMMLVPENKRTTINGEQVFPRKPVAEASVMLITEVANDDGTLSNTWRFTTLRIHEVLPGEKAHLYEMGIPVVETGDRWHVDIGQKVPLNMERDNVAPSYLRDVRVAVANATRDLLTVADANSPWARDALADHDCKVETVRKLVQLRFGDNVVIQDPSDPEANNKAVANGYVVVHGPQLSASEWERVKDAGAMKPAGQMFPTPKAFHPGGRPLKLASEVTPGMQRFVQFAKEAALACLGAAEFGVVFADDSGWRAEGAVGVDEAGIRTLYVNVSCFGGAAGFDHFASARLVEFLVHEFGHATEANHLSERYHDALCKCAAKLVRLAVESPQVFHE